MPTLAFYTLGCKVNQYETELMKELATEVGFEVSDFDEPADIYIVNTCAVTQVAEKKSRQAIRRASRLGKVMVTGCYSELEPDEIKKISRTLQIIKIAEKKDVARYLKDQRPETRDRRPLLKKVRAYLMIEDGCNQFCSYCVVPLARGKVISKPLPEILEEVEKLKEKGVKEVVLTGINLGAYGKETTDQNLAKVIKEIAKIDGFERIRLSSIEPMFINDELIETIAGSPKVCRHLHVPLQSGDDLILKKMNRTYTAKDFLRLVEKLRTLMPEIAITTDVMAGFPAETEEAFGNTCELIEQIKFSRMHIFRYSRRPNTPASQFEGQLNPWIIQKRSQKLRYLAQKYMLAYHRGYLGRSPLVLIEQKDKKTGLLEGLTDTYVRVRLKGDDKLIGRLVPVKIKESKEDYVLGEI